MRFPIVPRHPLAHAALAAALALPLAGCASSGLVSAWRDTNPLEAPMSNVLVVAMKKDAQQRRVWEDGMSAELAKRGVTATPSYRQWSDALPDTQQVIASVRTNGYDGVIVTFRGAARVETRRVPGYTAIEPTTRRRPWTGAYYSVYTEVHHSGYTETDRILQHETHVWSTKTPGGRLVWAGTSESVDPTSSAAVNRDIARTIVPELAKLGIIATARP